MANETFMDLVAEIVDLYRDGMITEDEAKAKIKRLLES